MFKLGNGCSAEVLDRWFQRFNRQCSQALKRFPQWQLVACLLLLAVAAIPLIVTSLQVWQQAALAFAVLGLGELAIQIDNRFGGREYSELSHNLHLFLIALSLLTTMRYLYYRVVYTLNFANIPDGIASVLLFSAELYAIVMLLLSFFQTLRIKHRPSIPLDEAKQDEWPKVDVYIPTYNEDVEIVRKTVLAALALDYPQHKKGVYILDDGRAAKYASRRKELYAMCDEISADPDHPGIVEMMTRDDNSHAKAGNINQTFPKTKGELVLILDCDHMPARSLLKEVVGFFNNEQLALVQTPHWFFNPDPFERNLLTRGKIPVNNELFYKVLQKGNDFWNATFFCGSAAVIRKEYVLQVGGIAVETVTEDCHTAFRLHSLGYKSFYYDKIMVAGLAPELLSAYVGQQVRWARGMAQILRTENPLINPKLNLTIAQRLCYFSATFCFFYGIPRLIYAVVPTLYLLFGINPIRGLGVETLLYALPHIILSLNANHIVHKHVRYSWWNELFEFVLAFQTAYVTFMAVINPSLGSFNVTDKGMLVTQRNFDWQSARYLLWLLGLIGVAICAVPFWILLRPEDIEATLVNAAWCAFNLVLLGGGVLVCLEQAQLRESHRLNRKLEATIFGPGRQWQGYTLDVSETGARIRLNRKPDLSEDLEVELVGDYGRRVRLLRSRIVWTRPVDSGQVDVGVDFGIGQNSAWAQPNAAPEEYELYRKQLDNLALVLYSDVKEWFSQHRAEIDRPLHSMWFIATAMGRALQEFIPYQSVVARQKIQLPAQLFWQGQFHPSNVTELGSRSLKLEAQLPARLDVAALERDRPVLGVRLRGPGGQFLNLVTQVDRLQPLQGTQRTAIELSFPESLRSQQSAKLKPLLAQLNQQQAAQVA
ncbi:glycosyltransferase family 2 protein [Synechococcus sp. PCC 7336]|uniref:glycosyltransferase n=1 Tax=Synechococcus sp. PCC 7336 TaxID=195250 RepID=UPI00034776F1|nr:glycosyltransferase family 2 protein [Synechococcus sp. PCC 7336]